MDFMSLGKIISDEKESLEFLRSRYNKMPYHFAKAGKSTSEWVFSVAVSPFHFLDVQQ